jgi:phage-related protein
MLIEAARTGDGQGIAEAFLSGLENARVHRKKNLDRLADVAVRFEDFARRGTLEVPRELREDLREGIGEIKAGDVRLLFFNAVASCHSLRIVRLTHGFIKGTERTPRREIDKALWVRREDQS